MLLPQLVLIASLTCAYSVGVPGSGPFRTVGSRVFDSSGAWVVFRGIGLSCTEYIARPIFPGSYGYDACFGGLSMERNASSLMLNGEINNVVRYLLPDTAGGSFATKPAVSKVSWPPPYDEVVSPGSPRVVPVVRIPVTSATYLFDDEANELTSAGYRRIIDLLIANLTSQGIAVIIDQHGNCAGGGKNPLNCSSREGPMSLRDFGLELNATLRFWANVSATYASNHMVLFEVRAISHHPPALARTLADYPSELNRPPHCPLPLADIQRTARVVNEREQRELLGDRAGTARLTLLASSSPLPLHRYQALYGGDPLYTGHSEMLQVIRANTPTGLVLISSTGYAQDAAYLLALRLQYTSQFGAPPSNVMAVMHPYQGMFQGVWIDMRSTMRLTLALQTAFPVIYTELGQYCCSAANTSGCGGPARCNDYLHGSWFVHNLLNMAAQLDVSWTGWAWRGTNANGGQCAEPPGQTECGYPDMRDGLALMTNGSGGGANWSEVWSRFAAADRVVVQDLGNASNIGPNVFEVKGFLPRPCILPNAGMGNACGWPLGFNVSLLPFNSLWNQSVGESVLPGLPPSGAPESCTSQACPGYFCETTSPVIPMPHPCSP